MLIRAAILSIVLAGSATAQATPIPDPILKIRAMVYDIDRNNKNYRTVQASRDDLGLERRSVENGWLRAYCDGTNLREILAQDDGETITGTRRFYFDHDSLFFYFLHNGQGQPNGKDPYPERTELEEERLYFAGGKLIRWIIADGRIGDFKSPAALSHAQTVLAEAHEYQQIMAGCTPRPRTQDIGKSARNSVALHDAAYAVIQKELPWYIRVGTRVDSLGLANLDAYCSSDAVRILVTNDDQGGSDRYYFDRDELFLVVSQPKQPAPEQRVYFTDGKIVRWLVGSTPRTLTSGQDESTWLSKADKYKLVMHRCDSR